MTEQKLVLKQAIANIRTSVVSFNAHDSKAEDMVESIRINLFNCEDAPLWANDLLSLAIEIPNGEFPNDYNGNGIFLQVANLVMQLAIDSMPRIDLDSNKHSDLLNG